MECHSVDSLASTSANAPGTMFPKSRAVQIRFPRATAAGKTGKSAQTGFVRNRCTSSGTTVAGKIIRDYHIRAYDA